MFDEIIIGIVILACLILFLVIFYSINQAKIKSSVLSTLSLIATNIDGTIKQVKNKTHDYEIETADKIYLLKFVSAFANSEIIITNYQRWYLNVVKDNTKSSKAKRVITEIVPFTNYKLQSNKKVIKVAIIYPSSKQILRYINESEVIFVTPMTDVWGYKVINYSNLQKDFNKL